MKKIKHIVILLLSFVIASCGFHLRGNQDLSAILPEVQLQGTDEHSELGRELRRALINAKVNVVEDSLTVLTVTRDDFSKRVLSLDSAGRANQYELSYHLSFVLVKKVQNESKENKQQLVDLIPIQNITQKREYLFDANLVLAKADEESRLNNTMREAAMLQLVRRLMFSLKSKAQFDKSSLDNSLKAK